MFKSTIDAVHSEFAADLSPIRDGFAPLDGFNPGLAARTASYVQDGSEAGVLLELPHYAVETGELLGKPGRLHHQSHFYQHDKKVTPVAEAALGARAALYRQVTERGAVAAAGVALLVRIGHVLEAIDGGQSLERTGARMPDWLHYLLNDALLATIAYRSGVDSDEELAILRPGWDIVLLRALLEQGDLAQKLALPIVFERREVAYMANRVYRRLLAPGALDDDMLARPDEVEAAARSLSAAGKIVLAERIGASDALRARYPAVLVRLATGDGKTVRAASAGLLDRLDRAACLAALDDVLQNGQGEARAQAATLLARLQGDAAQAPLSTALTRESSKAVQQAIRAALSSLGAAATAVADLPEPPPLPEWHDAPLGIDALDELLATRAALLEELRREAEAETARNRTERKQENYYNGRLTRYEKLDEERLRQAVRALNGETDAMPALSDPDVIMTIHGGDGLTNADVERFTSRTDFGLMQVLRWELTLQRRKAHYRDDNIWFSHNLQEWIDFYGPERVDLRQLSEAAAQCGADPDLFARTCLRPRWLHDQLPQAVLPPERVWPCLAQFPELIDAALAQAGEEFDLENTLSALATFPALPARWVPRLLEIAFGDSKPLRLDAQGVLGKVPDIGARVAEELTSSKQELRIEAARWLARIGYRQAIPALYAALDKEARETVSAELMTALEQLGEDLAPRLAPALLLAQAGKGLKGKPPAGLAWFPFDAVPACRWAASGDGVEPDIIRWWIILAAKLKDPSGNALLRRYLGLLDAASRATLGRFVLTQFIAGDIRHPSMEEALEYAAQHAPAEYQYNQQAARDYPDYYAERGELTQEQVFEGLKRAKLAEYRGNALGEKGILALSCAMPGHEMVDAIRRYMREHYLRRAQIEALLEAAAMSDERPAIQLLLATARRWRTWSIQQRARELVERVAERNGWSQDQLADRTMPTGGMDETGRMTFDYGAREFTVLLDAKLKPVLHDAAGKVLAALPAPRQNDPPESIKEGKALFTACKKEVKQVLDLQGVRLYDAMCTGRSWPLAEWDEYLRRHPLAGRLAQRLAWTVLDAGGAVRAVFRPTEDGSLIDAADDEVDLDALAATIPEARIGLAHAVLVDAGAARAWLAHFKDYKVAPLFDQFGRPVPLLPDLDAGTIDDRLGWMSDTYTLRAAFTRLGYVRAAPDEGTLFTEYTRDFMGAGLQVQIAFSGNTMPEDKHPAALKTLSFVRPTARSGVPLGQVPPVLLAEAYNDYHALAAACTGFDPDWQRKVPW